MVEPVCFWGSRDSSTLVSTSRNEEEEGGHRPCQFLFQEKKISILSKVPSLSLVPSLFLALQYHSPIPHISLAFGLLGSILVDIYGVRRVSMISLSVALVGRTLISFGRTKFALYLAMYFFSPCGDALLSVGLCPSSVGQSAGWLG